MTPSAPCRDEDAQRQFSFGRRRLLDELAELLATAADAEPVVDDPVKVILSDIEGCLNLDPLTYDHAVLNALREVNEAASWRNCIPFLTLCTGRQAPFVDAFSAFLSVRLPVIFEGGCGLFFPRHPPGHGRTQWHPRIAAAEGSGEYRRLEAVIQREAESLGTSQSLGKGRLLTFHAPPGETVDAIADAFRRAVGAAGLTAEITRSANAVDISVAGVNKGSAVHWLLETIAGEESVSLTERQIVGVGDAPNDVSFLKVVGSSVAPANAEHAIKRLVDHVSDFSDAKAVTEAAVNAMRRNLGR